MQLELPSPDVQIVLKTCGDAAGLFHQVFIAFLLLKVSLDDRFDRLCLLDVQLILQIQLFVLTTKTHRPCACKPSPAFSCSFRPQTFSTHQLFLCSANAS